MLAKIICNEIIFGKNFFATPRSVSSLVEFLCKGIARELYHLH